MEGSHHDPSLKLRFPPCSSGSGSVPPIVCKGAGSPSAALGNPATPPKHRPAGSCPGTIRPAGLSERNGEALPAQEFPATSMGPFDFGAEIHPHWFTRNTRRRTREGGAAGFKTPGTSGIAAGGFGGGAPHLGKGGGPGKVAGLAARITHRCWGRTHRICKQRGPSRP